MLCSHKCEIEVRETVQYINKSAIVSNNVDGNNSYFYSTKMHMIENKI